MKAFLDGIASIGAAWASFFDFFGGTETIQERVERRLGKKVVFDSDEEALQADADALRSDWEKVLGRK